MTPVFGHGRLRLYLLKLLDESPRHGYEIIQQLRERFAGLYAPSAGTVYPRLARLESEGLVRHETDGGRKVYHITDAGRAELTAKAAELEALESEIRDSVFDLAEGIRDEVRESARTVREELEAEAREAAMRAAEEAAGRGKASASDATADSGAGTGAGAGAGSGPWSGGRPNPNPFAGWRPPPESADWSREQWREWKREQQEQWRGQRDQWKDWQKAWKDQWARQWKEQWEAQQRQRHNAPPWAWLFSGAPFWGQDEPHDTPAGQSGAGSEPGTAAAERDRDREESGSGCGAGSGRSRRGFDRRGFEWDVFGPQLRDLFSGAQREAGPLFDAVRRHGALTEAERAQAKAIVDRAVSELRALFEGPDDQRPTDRM